jgi:branched-chain amino acid transport system permease protein
MEAIRDIAVSALTLGSIYAVSSVSLSLLWGSIGMLNLLHGAFMTIGAYASLIAVSQLGLPWWTGIGAGLLAGVVAGLITTTSLVQTMFRKPNFQVNIIILTMAAATIVVDLINNLVGPGSARQPFNIDGHMEIGGASIAYQTLLICGSSLTMVMALDFIIRRTALGRAIRAVAQEPTAALLNGISLNRVVLQTVVLASATAGVSGVLLTAWTTVYPTVGADPMLKALIVCIVGGLGSIPGAFIAAFFLATLEIAVQFQFGTKWGLPVLLLTVILTLVLRPNGLMGRKLEARH